MKNDVNAAELERIEVRAIQGLYPEAHQALQNWGAWSRFGARVDPHENPPPARIYAEIDRDEWDEDGYGEAKASDERLEERDVKAEAPRREKFDEVQAQILDERMHGPGGLAPYLRSAVRVAYYTREIPEDQFHRLCDPPCNPSTFRERLEDCLVFVSRYV